MPVLSSYGAGNLESIAHEQNHGGATARDINTFQSLYPFSDAVFLAICVVALILLVRRLTSHIRYMMQPSSSAPSSLSSLPISSKSDPVPNVAQISHQREERTLSPMESVSEKSTKRLYAPPQPWTSLRTTWIPPPPRPTLQLERDLSYIKEEVHGLEVTQSPSYVESFQEPLPPLLNSMAVNSETGPREAAGATSGADYNLDDWWRENREAEIAMRENGALDFSVRRRSYTKVLDGSEGQQAILSGELVNSPMENWSRHTRVYGGGVCLACLESEEKMRA